MLEFNTSLVVREKIYFTSRRLAIKSHACPLDPAAPEVAETKFRELETIIYLNSKGGHR